MKLKYITAALLAMAIAPMQAMAGTATANLDVSLNNIAPSATVSTGAVAFGDVLTTNYTPTAQGSITVNVSNTVAYTVELDAGNNSTTGTTTCRAMTGGSSARPYRLYSDSGLTTDWGDSDGANTCSGKTNNGGAKVSGTGNGADQVLTVYAKAGGGLRAGLMSDTVVVTVTF